MLKSREENNGDTTVSKMATNLPTISRKESASRTSPTSQSVPCMSQVVHLPGVSVLRNPILGESYNLRRSNYPWLNNRRSRVPSTSQTEHERSIFTSTGMVRSFYIIHPDWNSEVGGHRRLRSSVPKVETPRIQASLSAQETLRERLIPLLQKKAKLNRPLPEGLSVYLLGVRDGYKQARAIEY